jgi:hypothetical protein
MALTPEDMEQIKQMLSGFQAPAAETAPEPVSPDPAPAEYYVHLADGRVLETADSASTHIDGVLVIGRYPMSDEAKAEANGGN